MVKDLTRRSFVAVATLAGAATALSATGCFKKEEQKDEEPDEKVERKVFATTCHGCIQSCPVRAYVEDGIVVKIEGNPYAPTSMGSLCMKGLNQIHTLYSPRRVLYPLKRTGTRGPAGAKWERVTWDEAVELAATKIADSIEKYGTYSFFASVGGGGSYSGSPARLVPRAMGSPTVFEPGCAQCYLPRVCTGNLMWGSGNQSIADCSTIEMFKGLSKYEQAKGLTTDTKGLVLWGAQPSVSQTAQSGRGMAEIRAKGVKTIVVDPNYSPDAVKADIWLRVRAGSDAALLLSWFRYIFANKLYNEEFVKFWTNLPVIINPETKLPFYANDVFPEFKQTTPENTPAFVCYNNKTGAVEPLEFGDPEKLKATMDPEIFWTGKVNGVTCKTAGQLYKENAEPWTLEATEKECWVPADLNEKAIRLYTNADKAITPVDGGVAFGIVMGVAAEMEQDASQVCLGCMGLDFIMGYVNKKGATLTNKSTVMDTPQPRPTFKDSAGYPLNFTYVVGQSDAENEARIAGLEGENAQQGYIMNQLVLDRLGTRNHKGLNAWWHSHIPSVLEAIKTGIPYKPRVWFDMSGNKLAVLGTAGAWANVFPEVDFCLAQYPMMTSFQVECADVMFPMCEWLESPNAARDQQNYSFGMFPMVHLGETASNTIAPYRVTMRASQILNERMANGTKILLGYVGTDTGYYPEKPSFCSVAADEELQTSVNGTAIHARDEKEYTLKFPLCSMNTSDTQENEDALLQTLADLYCTGTGKEKGSMTYDELVANYETLMPQMDAAIANDKGWVKTATSKYWKYGQHLAECDDGLPMGFGTESRKCEVYCTAFIKLARTGWPYCWPRPQDPCDPTIGQEIKDINPDYDFVGEYSPMCVFVDPKESPLEDHSGYNKDFPLVVTSGRLPHFHHSTMRHAPYARECYPIPKISISPAAATERGIVSGDWVEVSSQRGSVHAIAYVTAGMADKACWMERFYNPECYDSSQKNVTGGWEECNINVITKNTAPYNDVFGSYTNRGFCIQVKKSTKPDNVWYDPTDFQPFMPTNKVGWAGYDSATNGVGVAMEANTARVKFSAL